MSAKIENAINRGFAGSIENATDSGKSGQLVNAVNVKLQVVPKKPPEYQTLAGVRVSSAELEAAADSIANHTTAIEVALNEFMTVAENTGSVWSGGSSEEFMSRCSACRPRINSAIERMTDSFGKLRSISDMYSAADRRIQLDSSELPSDAIK